MENSDQGRPINSHLLPTLEAVYWGSESLGSAFSNRYHSHVRLQLHWNDQSVYLLVVVIIWIMGAVPCCTRMLPDPERQRVLQDPAEMGPFD